MRLLLPLLLFVFAIISPAASNSGPTEAMYEIEIAGDVADGFTSAEILRGEQLIARVYELPDGWRFEFREASTEPLESLLAAIDSARASLMGYVNRTGANRPSGLSKAGLSLWLMEKADGTAMGRPLSGGAK